MKSLAKIFCLLLIVNTLSGQLDMLQVEKGSKEFKLVIPDPFIIPEFPVGLIYQDTSGIGFSNLNDYHLRVASKPVGFQYTPENLLFTEVSNNAFSINRIQGANNELYLLGPNQMGYWGPRNPVSPFQSEYDLQTFGNIWTKNSLNKKMSELTQCGGRGALKLYWYDGGAESYHTLGVDDDGNIKWLAASSISLLDNIFLVEEPILPYIPKLQLKRFRYKGFKNTTQGYIAEEVQEIFPELVSEMDNGSLGVNYAGFTPIALQAIKEQQEIIDSLIDRIESLEKAIQN